MAQEMDQNTTYHGISKLVLVVASLTSASDPAQKPRDAPAAKPPSPASLRWNIRADPFARPRVDPGRADPFARPAKVRC